ncbi:hypothetical protein [Tychonema sp. BBK16]|uniref:hypothetical protein n=1 Tax=Tychonema sp. BBK16 TaxID=2699888 RepID=UPI001F4743E5|nr:hypothetical protein [Tychonema sp. BBK16]MCF6372607.1 hypothetical protein [Tychonema sp. BBK16]
MRGQEALAIVDRILQTANHGQKLNNLQSAVFLEAWEEHSYSEIAHQLGYEYDYIKQVGSQLWRSLSQILGEPVSKRNIQAVLRRYQQLQQAQQNDDEAIALSRFYDRAKELQIPESSIIEDPCRLIGMFGLPGVGKAFGCLTFIIVVGSDRDK